MATGWTGRFMEFFGPGTAASLLPVLEDLAGLFEQGAAGGTPVRAKGPTSAIDRAAGEDTGNEGMPR